MKPRVNPGHASAQQLKRESVDSERDHMHLIICVDEVLAQCEVSQTLEKAPRVPAVGTSTAATASG